MDKATQLSSAGYRWPESNLRDRCRCIGRHTEKLVQPCGISFCSSELPERFCGFKPRALHGQEPDIRGAQNRVRGENRPCLHRRMRAELLPKLECERKWETRGAGAG